MVYEDVETRLMDIGTCRLCNSHGPLRGSHIIPSFVFRWIKQSASTPFLRFGENMNKRVQDGLKPAFLCEQCEGRFNSWETPFAASFFHPLHDDAESVFQYGPWMEKCAASIVWRILAWRQEQKYANEEVSALVMQDIGHALETWRRFLLDESESVGDHELHLVPLGPLESVDGPAAPGNINRYLLRSVDMDFIRDSLSATVYCKMGRALLLGFVREPEAQRWKGTRIEVGGGTLGGSDLFLPDWLLKHLWTKAARREQLESSISARQKDAIARSQSADPKRVSQSDTLQAVISDVELQLGRKRDRTS